MGKLVPIDSIVINRTLDPGDDITKLADHIHDSGLAIPVLVNQNYELIDGLRRIAAVRSLGNETIEIVAVTMFGPAATWLQRAREHGVEAKFPLSPRRIWELYSSCIPLISMSRSHEMRGRPKGRGAHVNGRSRFLEATGINSESYLQATVQIYRMTGNDSMQGELAREAVELLERGQLSVYMAVEYVKTRSKRSDIVKASDQVPLLNNTVSTLNGITHGLDQLGPIDQEVPADVLAGISRDLKKFRRTLHQLIHKLDKEQESR